MRHIIRGEPTLAEKLAAEVVLNQHQKKYGDYGRRTTSETYRMSFTPPRASQAGTSSIRTFAARSTPRISR
jgi:hypothetical protein